MIEIDGTPPPGALRDALAGAAADLTVALRPGAALCLRGLGTLLIAREAARRGGGTLSVRCATPAQERLCASTLGPPA